MKSESVKHHMKLPTWPKLFCFGSLALNREAFYLWRIFNHNVANAFATQFLPQLMKDLHYCGNEEKLDEDEACFPALVGMVQSIHCEMHICVIERNEAPAKEPTLEESKLPANALDMKQCKSMLPGHW